jgi:hypothetical protein
MTTMKPDPKTITDEREDLAFGQAWRRANGERLAAPAGLAQAVLLRAHRAPARPVMALRWALALLLAGGLGFWAGHRDQRVLVTFDLDAPRAQSVALAGDFNGWKPQALERQGGRWQLALALPARKHHYVFVLNGRRIVLDPEQPAVEADENGEAFSVLDLKGTTAL